MKRSKGKKGSPISRQRRSTARDRAKDVIKPIRYKVLPKKPVVKPMQKVIYAQTKQPERVLAGPVIQTTRRKTIPPKTDMDNIRNSRPVTRRNLGINRNVCRDRAIRRAAIIAGGSGGGHLKKGGIKSKVTCK